MELGAGIGVLQPSGAGESRKWWGTKRSHEPEGEAILLSSPVRTPGVQSRQRAHFTITFHSLITYSIITESAVSRLPGRWSFAMAWLAKTMFSNAVLSPVWLAHSGLSATSMQFLASASKCLGGKFCWNSASDGVESMDQLRKNCHLKNTESGNPQT